MFTNKCPLCDKRKGVRYCPALNFQICSLCCGTKRRRTISCPDDCFYLITGRAYQVQRIPDIALIIKIREVNPEYMNGIEQSILLIRATRFRDLLDSEVKLALENILKTLETAERKIIYEYRSPNPKIQIVADSVTQTIKKYLRGEAGERSVSINEAKIFLKTIINALTTLVDRNSESTVYLDFIQQLAKESQKSTPDIISDRIIH